MPATLIRHSPLLLTGAALLVAALLALTRPAAPPVTLPERAWTVEVIEVRQGSLRPTLDLYGRLESLQDAGVTAAVAAAVVGVPVRDGEVVAAGQPLLQLDERESRLALVQREAELRDLEAQVRLEQQRIARNRAALEREFVLLGLVERDAARALDLRGQGVLSQADLDAVTENLTRQQLALNARELAVEEGEIRLAQLAAQLLRAGALRDQAGLDRERMQIVAPFAGAVSGLAVSEGDRAQAGQILMRIHNPAKLQLRVQIPTRHAFRIRDALADGVAITARVELDGALYPARLERVSAQIRQGAGTVESFVALDALPPGLSALGATARVELSLPPEPDAIAVPAEAIYGHDRLFRVAGERMQGVTVERLGERTLPEGGSEVLIRSAELVPGDRIIVTRLATAADGLLVRIAESAGGSPASAAPARQSRLAGD